MKKKNLVVVGYGGQGGWHCEHALKSDIVTLRGIYDIKPERNALAESRGIHAYASLEEVLADREVDLITVATPNDTHTPIVLAALNAGKNVICEKPVEMTLEALDEMLATAKKNNVHFSVHQNRRWDVDFLAMKNIIEEGKIGAPIRIESRIMGSRGIPSDWRGEKAHGGGMILDWGVHLIDQMTQLITDPIKTVYCETTHITNNEVDDGFRLNLTFTTGKTAYVEVATYNFIALPRFYMTAEKGSALITDWRENAIVAKCKAWNEKDVLPVQTAAGITKTMAPRDEITLDTWKEDKPTSDVHDFYRNFTASIDGECEQLIQHWQSRRVLKIMLACFESAEKGIPVPFDENR